MAASSNKRKQDEKYLKILRDIVALQHNKHCFDCHQRGPTYVNMTVGAFVCTSCSGILRGLNPPHRVKSISMATFSPDEMDFLKGRGNEFCRKVWLNGFKPSLHREPDSKDEHKVRDFMADKYEKKRFYLEGNEILHEEARKMNTPVSKLDTKQLRSITGATLPTLRLDQTHPTAVVGDTVVAIQPPTISTVAVTQSSTHTSSKGLAFDLLSDIGGDPFVQSNIDPIASTNTTTPGTVEGFADFSNFGDARIIQAQTQHASNVPGLLQPSNSCVTPIEIKPSGANNSVASASDKYAALATLDSALSINSAVNWESTSLGSSGGWSSLMATGAPTSIPPQTNTTATNPFSTSHLGTSPQSPLPTPAGNPFVTPFSQQQSNTFPHYQQPTDGGNLPQYAPLCANAAISRPPFNVINGFGNSVGVGRVCSETPSAASTSMVGGATRQFAAWPQSHVPVNPFMAQTAQHPVPPRSSSTNPFL